ncbi:MAG: hypothetical protein KC505_08690 [Myxococcales bacterium]|nr:hypothetical protein [Myxococcales bacterium]USN50080.1 MAG: hypothetical protein H6731_07345 [Myxococcales bacterium]
MKLINLLSILFIVSCSNEKPSSSDNPNNKQPIKDDNQVNYLARPNQSRSDQRQLQNFDCSSIKNSCVSSLNWGLIEISSPLGKKSYKDAIVWWQGSKEWNWKIGDVHHKPGITVEALDQLLSIQNISDIIFSRGMEGVLQVPQKTIDAALSKGIKVHVAFTRDAAELYNKLLKEGKNVGAFFHSTC